MSSFLSSLFLIPSFLLSFFEFFLSFFFSFYFIQIYWKAVTRRYFAWSVCDGTLKGVVVIIIVVVVIVVVVVVLKVVFKHKMDIRRN